ncbi:class I SAM-dependent methyltransferase [Ramlibacter sp. Leaf400]|uniref:class I SAM-dependent methyltransferase n=1 Tax=Ramlibacter sp. Leaf400 TaxID=1736365 RepID=UPI0006FA8E52|nr:class I SAM-dependent methyltransferase [Ramlibacter sp. Leaf400]KQT09445.1 SAM-dependent methyltransferase [Ramlibacter sp. Leaf400]
MTQPRRPVDFDPHRRAVSIALPASLAALAYPALPLYAQDAKPKLDVPYVPTPMEVVNKMLDMGKVGASDVLYDLGCGDGRIVVTAAKERGARGVGIDIDPQRIAEANENAEKAGVKNRVEFRVGDLFQADFAPATVVTLYLLPDLNRKLRPQLWQQLKVGTRVVSHAFDMGDEWPPERTERVDFKTIYSWTIRPEHKKSRA